MPTIYRTEIPVDAVKPAALVTGAARGIGLAIATQLAQDGFKTILTDIDHEEVQAASKKLQEMGLDVAGHVLDVRDRAAVSRLFDTVDGLTVVVNNAAISAKLKPYHALEMQAFLAIFSINVQGCFIVAQEGAKRMKAGGRIINIASRGYLGGAGLSHYVASKAAVVGLTRAMAIELRWENITVNAIAPGMVDTRMMDDYTAEIRRTLESREPSGGPANPAEIAQAVAFLASEKGRFINGQVLMVDGGKSLGMPPL
ncbi:SDR family NAD(P)-dependent oxidoreductase [Glaciimonas sp. Gout2]|uniref:SDR family NAD(P)-dependent oxidoreductase n=1 Tax=unclassified Glaciimonas TaxID=2644401 RepID=UPI002B226262|nr:MULTISPECIES: SDR family NAD(P)-dependent oxidoreductase [unclassified Glaciimonas]MEB0014419.1 SDR family NAD(P)-dependent oxidoreductase [Glaciimonas sp. Cout2]MEB0082879.1 SDR family NAD(P)-dependent oxidoreductase [Glaciimonas sp. Gout2]